MGTIFEMKEIPGDCLIALGTSFNDLETGSWRVKLPKRILHVDADSNAFNNAFRVEVTIRASVETFLEEISEKVKLPKWEYSSSQHKKIDSGNGITHDYLASVLDSSLMKIG